MSEIAKPPLWFWVVAVLALLWNAMGSMNFMAQLSPAAVAEFPESHRAVIEGRPIWATAGFGVAVFGATIGSVLMLLRKKLAAPFFWASLVGTILTLAHALPIQIPREDYSPIEAVFTGVLPIFVAGLLIWLARSATEKGWLR